MNELVTKVFKGREVRSIKHDNGSVWFVAKDVCDCLGIGNSRQACKRLKDKEKDSVILNDAIGRERNTTIVSESGLYKLIMQSKKAEAEEFQDWITEEVIPDVRKHGAYMTPDAVEKAITDPDFLIKLANNLKKEQQARIAAEEKNQIFFNNEKLLTATDIVSMLAKEQGITFLSAQQFNKEMQRLKILKNVNGEWQPTADKGMWLKEQGYLTYKDEIADNGFPLGVKVRYYASFVGYLIDNYYNQKEMFA